MRIDPVIPAPLLGLLLLACGVAPALAGSPASVELTDLRCEYLAEPLGLDVVQPRLSWKLKPVRPWERGQRQSGWHVLVASSKSKLTSSRADLWDSGEVMSSQAAHIVYRGKPLVSGQECYWTVRVRDNRGAWTYWSAPARWTMGLLAPGDWTAQWIGTDQVFVRQKGWPPPDNTMPDPWLRKTFNLPARPGHAFIHVASVGYHELYVNGKRVGDAVLAPPVTNHKKRARYVTYEIGPLLQRGGNVIALWLGTSWSIFPPYKTEDRPQSPIVLAQADIQLADGTTQRVVTDGTWKTRPSPNTLLGVWDFMHFGGELYDARQEVPGWNEVKFNDADWTNATVFSPKLTLSAAVVEPNRLVREIKPVAVTDLSNGVYRVDMGVNFAGWLELKLKGKPGDRIDISSSERLEESMTHRLHSACIIAANGRATFRHRFNYHSGRWLVLRGLSYRPALGDIRGWLVRTDFERTGEFECDSPLLNRIYETTLWTLENLSLGGYIVDCPQRERMGYGGDAHATMPTALANYSLGAFYTKWSEDWRDVQGQAAAWGVGQQKGDPGAGDKVEVGNLPYTAPTYWGGGGPGWSGYCITLPWQVYRQYGDTRILERNLQTIERWLAFVETKATNDLLRRYGGQWDFLGDWLWPGAKGVNGDTVETLFLNNCIWLYQLQTAARIAEAVGRPDLALRWRERAEAVRATAHRRFFNPEDNSYVNGLQSYLAIALYVDLPPAELRPGVWRRLEKEILDVRQGHIWAGITGGAFLFSTLMANDRNDLVYAMAGQEEYPGWGHMLKQGATTMWEDWEGRQSLLHSSYLYVGAWFIEGLAGIKPDLEAPGFRHIIIRPALSCREHLKRVKGAYNCIYGRIESGWETKSDRLVLNVTVPPNTRAKLCLPDSLEGEIHESGKSLETIGYSPVAHVGAEYQLRLEPGRYHFELFLK